MARLFLVATLDRRLMLAHPGADRELSGAARHDDFAALLYPYCALGVTVNRRRQAVV